MGCLPWETILHELLQCESFPWAAIHEPNVPALVPSTGYSPLGTDCSSRGSPVGSHVTCPGRRHTSAWASLSMVHRSRQVHPPAQASIGSQSPLGTHLWHGGFPGVPSGCLHLVPPQTTGAQPGSPQSSPMGGQGISAPAPGASPAAASLPLVTAELLRSHAHSCLSATVPTQTLFPLLKSVIPRLLHLGAIWQQLCQTWGKLLTSHTCYQNLSMQA